MATWRYRASDAARGTYFETVEAESRYDAIELVRAAEGDTHSIERVDDLDDLAEAGWTDRRRLEPSGPVPGPAPREVPPGITGMAGGSVLMIVGAIFSVVASIFIIVGLGLILGGSTSGWWFVLFPMIHLTVGVGLLVVALRSRSNRKEIYRSGESALATVEAVGVNTAVRINGRHPPQLRWSFDLDGHNYGGKRSKRNAEIADFRIGDRLWILYDPDNPDKSVEWPPL